MKALIPPKQSDGKVRPGLSGLWIGDALAMPVHWYYDRFALKQDYGRVTEFLPPRNPHPDSIFWRSRWDAPSKELDILGDQRRFWGQRNVHYHQNLRAGENTLTVKLAAEVWKMMNQIGAYNASEYVKRYVNLLTSPEKHGDTYIEECHRGFFTNLGKGIDPMECAVPEKHISGLSMMLPVALYYADDPDMAQTYALQHLSLTHQGKEMRTAAEAVLSLILPVLGGRDLVEVIEEECAAQRNPHFGFPFSKWLKMEDERVIGRELSTACYVNQAVPAVIYLALKYSDRPMEGLIANTNLGGDNAHRGSVLGALLGAANGEDAWPDRWAGNLLEPPLYTGD